ncbi:hypothetical protein BO94DRAFT_533908 [Aspergillus sclerotioniger CBS 115572]|uniref:Xylanolytic transcriptional activator regulatory domain-containing protein n=1 Tax=Aspergillus sclerotioniger CBS 115572 TaxID=1450535 RepID=A0A317X1K9_9EURO|nr:hypothetical protein BO94DRAFT_533908 [Aspergillus sclerotioniger CBS 115572]PWY90430.1 hypothetical protein BO94DRAFT_533908 [Aspergillus sclerotioniger CBS 115572]
MVAAYDSQDRAELDRLFRTAKDQVARGNHGFTSTGTKSASTLQKTRFRSITSSSSTSSADKSETLKGDINKNERRRATGYIGKSSEIAWLQNLGADVDDLDFLGTNLQPRVKEELSTLSYHLDHMNLSGINPGDLQALPPRSRGDNLVNIYFAKVDSSFPLLDKSLFWAQYDYAFCSPTPPQKKWLVILNLIFAIGSKYLQIHNQYWTDEIDDRVFLSRAMALNADENLLGEHADLQQVQIWALYAFYHLASSQISRAWHMAGRSIRCAIALGLNTCENRNDVDSASRDIRTRMWWALFGLEQLLSVMTGRDPCIDWRFSSVLAPALYETSKVDHPLTDMPLGSSTQKKQLVFTIHTSRSDVQARNQLLQAIEPGNALYFFYITDLAIITHAAVNAIYSQHPRPGSHRDSGTINTRYQRKLETWLSSLHGDYTFADAHGRPQIVEQSPERISLALRFYSSQIILNRPYITSPDFQIETGARYPRSLFQDATALICVQSAMDMVSLFPDPPDMEWMCRMTNWWTTVHYLMQALVILLIQLCVGPINVAHENGHITSGGGAVGTAEEPEVILQISKKCIRWLHTIAERSPSSRRALITCERFLYRIARTHGFDLEGLPPMTTLSERTATGEMGLYYMSSDPTSPLVHSLQSQGESMQDAIQTWGADFTKSEPDAAKQVFSSTSLDPTLLEVLDTVME